MKKYVTKIKAINPLNGDLVIWHGPIIKADNWNEAEKYLQLNGLGYCSIYGEFVAEVEFDLNSWFNNN